MFNLRKQTFAPLHRYGETIAFLGLSAGLIALSYGWSLGETEKAMALVVTTEWSLVAALVVQFGPQPSFILSSLTREQKYENRLAFFISISGLALMLGLFWNGIDFLTNLASFLNWYDTQVILSTLDPAIVKMMKLVGGVMCFIVTWSEELALLFMAAGLEHYRQVRLDLGKSAPNWMKWDVEGLARKAAGRSESGQQRSTQQHQQQESPEITEARRRGMQQQAQEIRARERGRP